MKVETWIFAITALFFLAVTPFYWWAAGDPTGTTALAMTFFLAAMVAGYLGFHARRMDLRPEDDKAAEIPDGAGELGFFPPYSWWPLWCAMTLAAIVYGIAIRGWWLAIIGAAFGVIALCGWVFEYYRGEHAH